MKSGKRVVGAEEKRQDESGYDESSELAALTHPRTMTSSESALANARVCLYSRGWSPTVNTLFRGRFGLRTFAKRSPLTRPAEAANMIYVARHTTIPVPRVHDVLAVGGRTCIVMDYVDGEDLSTAWYKLSEQQKTDVFKELKGYIAQIRALKPPHPGRVEAADGTGVFDSRMCKLGNKPMPVFNSVEEFHEDRGHNYLRTSERHLEVRAQLEAIEHKKYRTVFTHGDIAGRNIRMKNGKIAAFIDWEFAGWYPEYWEYCRWIMSNDTNESIRRMRDSRDYFFEDAYPDEQKVVHYVADTFTEL